MIELDRTALVLEVLNLREKIDSLEYQVEQFKLYQIQVKTALQILQARTQIEVI